LLFRYRLCRAVTWSLFIANRSSCACIDINEQKINHLLQGISLIYEPALEDLLTANMGAGRLHFTTSLSEALTNAEIIVIAVGTPQGDDGAADLSYLVQAAKDISPYITRETIIVIKIGIWTSGGTVFVVLIRKV
jgi:UDP-glucose 6-dehydrogenase